MKNYRVTVNGVSYDVAVDELDNVTPSLGSGQPTAALPPATPAQDIVPAPPITSSSSFSPAGASTVKSPMPGVILDVCVSIGDTIVKNQAVVILEAMKMENDIVSPYEGTVTAIHVTKGDNVETGVPLVSLR